MDHAGSNVLTTAQVAAALNIDDSHVRRLAIRYEVGRKLSDRVRLFSQADVETLRAKLKPGAGRPKSA